MSDRRQPFGRAMRDARKASTTPTLRALREAMEARGDKVTEASLSGYERGEYAPDRARAILIEDVLGVAPALTDLLGYTRHDDAAFATRADLDQLRDEVYAVLDERLPAQPRSLGAALDELRDTTQAMRQRITELEARRDAGASDPGGPPR